MLALLHANAVMLANARNLAVVVLLHKMLFAGEKVSSVRILNTELRTERFS